MTKLEREVDIKRAKTFGWKVMTFCFGLLFIGSVVACVLFATGIIEVKEKEEGFRFEFSSPLSMNNNSSSQSADDKASSGTTVKNPAAFESKIDTLLEKLSKDSAKADYRVTDLRVDSNSDIVAVLLEKYTSISGASVTNSSISNSGNSDDLDGSDNSASDTKDKSSENLVYYRMITDTEWNKIENPLTSDGKLNFVGKSDNERVALKTGILGTVEE